MILREFPDLKWIQKQSSSNFQNKIGAENTTLNEQGWPSVVLHVTSNRTKRDDIKAPFSLFTNNQGRSHITVGGKDVSVSGDTYCLVNRGDSYDLTIAENQTQTFNVHFGERLYTETIDSILRSHKELIDNPTPIESNVHLPLLTHWKDAEVSALLKRLEFFYASPSEETNEEDLLVDLLTLLMIKSDQNTKGIENIKAQTKTTRQELFHRIGLARDLLHDQYLINITIDELAQTAMLSKYHFLRTFKSIYGCSPHQYLNKIRLQKAKTLLNGNIQINEIARKIGFEEANSFFSFFKKKTGLTPSQYRALI